MNMKNIFVILFGLVMLFNLNFATPDIMVNGSDPCYEGVTTNYSTITEAVAAASDGESIIVCANGTIEDGIYVEDAIGIGTAIFIYGNESGVRFQTNDGEVGFVIQSANVNVTNFSISSNGAYGIAVDNKDNATIYDVTINGSTYGIYVTGANYSNLTSNTIYDTTSTGIYLNTSTHDHTVTSNTIYNTDGIYLEASVANTTLLYNYIYNTSTYGIGMGEVSTGNNFTSNNITNSTYGFRLSNAVVVRFSGQVMNNATYGIDLTNSSLNFSGNNEINTIPADGMPVYLDNSTINTGSYYITTDYFRFGLGETTDVSVQLVNLSNISDEDYTTMSTLSGVTAAYKKVVQSLQNNYYGLNVTNTSGSASFSPKLYYNDSDISFPYSNTYAGLGATSTLGAWTYYSPTTSVAGESVAYTGLSITAAAYFASIVYAPPVSSSTSSKSKGTIILTYELTCKDGTVSVYAKEASEELSGVKIILLGISSYYSDTQTTDSNGLATYTITKDGTYKLIATKDNYYTQTLTNIDFALCPEITPVEVITEPEQEETPVVVEQEEEEIIPVETPSQDKLDADAAIITAQEEIVLAEIEGKITAEAKQILEDAKTAYASGDYKSAKELAVYSATLIVEPAAEPEAEPEVKKTEQPKQDNTLMYLLGAVIVVVILAGAYYFLKGKGSSGFKGYKK